MIKENLLGVWNETMVQVSEVSNVIKVKPLGIVLTSLFCLLIGYIVYRSIKNAGVTHCFD